MKIHIAIFTTLAAIVLAPCAWARSGWVDESETGAFADNIDALDAALRMPGIEPIQPFVAPLLHEDPLVEQCDLKPEVAQVYRASVLSDSTRHPSLVTSAKPIVPNTGARSARGGSRMRDPQGDMSASEGVNILVA